MKLGRTIEKLFTTRRFDTGVLIDADSTPTGTIYKNGVADALAVTVTKLSTGTYRAVFTPTTGAGFAAGDDIELVIAATVNLISDAAPVLKDTLTTADIDDVSAAAGVPIPYAPTSATRTVGTDEGGTVANLAARDESYFSTGEVNSGNLLEVEVERSTSVVSENPAQARVSGYYSGGAGHSISIQAWNYLTSAWVTLGTMLTRTSAFDYVVPLDATNHDGSTGAMKLRFLHSAGTGITSHRLHLDYISFEKLANTSALTASVASIKAKTDQLNFTLTRVQGISTLEDDAISAGKFDESTAFPVKSADTGATALARTGADGDTLETLSDQLDLAALEATLTAIKGAGWTTETLVALDVLLDAIKAKTDGLTFSGANVQARVADKGVLNDIAAADVWAVGTRTLTSFGTLAADTATAVWAASTRTLTSFGTLAADTATAVWAAGTRTLTSFGTLVADIWANSTRTLTSFGTLAADTATAVWAAGTRTLTSFGTLAADAATAVWAAASRTLTSFGSLVSDIWTNPSRVVELEPQYDAAKTAAQESTLTAGLSAIGSTMALDATVAKEATLNAVGAVAASRAAPGDEMDLVDAPNATAVAAIQAGLATDGDLAAVAFDVTLARMLLQNRMEIDLVNSKAVIYADDAVTPFAEALLTDSDGDPVTVDTTGPINRGPWEVLT